MSDHAHHVIVIPDDGDYTENKLSTDYEMMSRRLVERDMRGSVMPDLLTHPIREDYLSGMSYVAIGQKYGIDQRTAKRYAFHNLPMDNLQQRPFQSKMDDFRLVISAWLKDGKIPSAIIHDKLVEMGCICSYTTVNDYVQKTLRELEGDEWNPVEAISKNRIRSLKSEDYRKRQLHKINSEKARIMHYK